MKTSHSKLKTWRRCHKSYDYKYIQRLRPRRKGQPLLFGDIVHQMIEADANGDDPFAKLAEIRASYAKAFREQREMYDETVNMAASLMQAYFPYYRQTPVKYLKHKKTGKLAEHEFEMELAKDLHLVLKLDGVGQSTDKRVWLVEHKTGGNIPDEGVRFRDVQTALYVPAMEQMGFPIPDGIMWNYLRRKAPTVPEVLKAGGLSQRANIDTTPAVYLQAIQDNGLNPRDYASMLASLKGRESNFFKRIYMPINPTLSKQLIREAVETADEIEERAGKDTTRNITRDCSFCEFEGLCRAELMGLDTDMIRKKDYEVRK